MYALWYSIEGSHGNEEGRWTPLMIATSHGNTELCK